jgi:hypothetical protein
MTKHNTATDPEACSKVIDGVACTMPKGHRCPDCSGDGDGVALPLKGGA